MPRLRLPQQGRPQRRRIALAVAATVAATRLHALTPSCGHTVRQLVLCQPPSTRAAVRGPACPLGMRGARLGAQGLASS
eukprot:365443-Chlamydomonas_euryale.AAC.28